MQIQFLGYQGEDVYALVAGGDTTNATVSFIPKDVLTKIPYFQAALRSGAFLESETKTFYLTEDDATAIADVIFFSNQMPNNPPAITESKRLRLACILADKWLIDAVHNKFLEMRMGRYGNPSWDPYNTRRILTPKSRRH